ncbi:MAG: hypothetical protein AAF533_02035 [Acidobacteriota bacterium]
MRHDTAARLFACLLLTALLATNAQAYPSNKSECDDAGGTWVGSSDDSGFCYMFLKPDSLSIAVDNTGGSGLTEGIVLGHGPDCADGPVTVQQSGHVTEGCYADGSLSATVTDLVAVTDAKGETYLVPRPAAGTRLTSLVDSSAFPTGAILQATVASHPTEGSIFVNPRRVGSATYLEARRPGDVVAEGLSIGRGETVMIGREAAVNADLDVGGGNVVFLPGSSLERHARARGSFLLVFEGATVGGDVTATSFGRDKGIVVATSRSVLDGGITSDQLTAIRFTDSQADRLSSTDDDQVVLINSTVSGDLTVTNGRTVTSSGNAVGGTLTLMPGSQTRSLLMQ